MEKTKEAAKQWIEAGNPCARGVGFMWKGGRTWYITKEEALELLPKYSFGMGYYEISWKQYNGKEVLMFREYSESDMF